MNKENIELSKLNKIDLFDLLFDLNNWMISYKDYLDINSSRVTFGIEIEYERAIYDDIGQKINEFNKDKLSRCFWNLKQDNTVMSTINNHKCGGEVISPILDNRKEYWDDISNICRMLRNNNAVAGNSSAAHIHFGSQILGGDEAYYINFIKLWYIYEKIIYRFSYGEKLSARDSLLVNAQPISITNPNLKDIIINSNKMCIYSDEFKRATSNKYVGLNLRNVSGEIFSKGNTIEVRCPNGTLNETIWQNNINFFAKFLLAARNDNLDVDLLDYKLKKMDLEQDLYLYSKVYLKEAIELCDLLFDNTIDKYDFLKQYLKDFKFDNVLRDKRVNLTRKRSSLNE